MTQHAPPARASGRRRRAAALPWPVAVLLVLNVVPELILQLADHGIMGPIWLRPVAYVLGAFQPDLIMRNHAVFPGQALSMFFTYGLLHTGVFHLTVNMIVLVWLGRLVLDYRTPETFLTFYLISTVGAAEMFALIGPAGGSVVGASGALFGLMGLYAVDNGLLAPGTGVRHGMVLRIVGVTVALALADLAGNLLLGTAVAWQAHAGGFLTGAALAMIYPPRHGQRS